MNNMSEESNNQLNYNSLQRMSVARFNNIRERDIRILQNRKSLLEVRK
jgi:hypothetical protein